MYDWSYYSKLTYELLGMTVPLQVCRDTEDGWFIGAVATAQVDDVTHGAHRAGEILARDSEEFYPDFYEAYAALGSNTWTQRARAHR